jgi:hypothetical protein
MSCAATGPGLYGHGSPDCEAWFRGRGDLYSLAQSHDFVGDSRHISAIFLRYKVSGISGIPGSLALGQNAAHVRAPHETTGRA